MLRFFENYPEILAVMSEREDGSMKILNDDENENNRREFFLKNKIDDKKVFAAEIVHSDCVEIVDKNSDNFIKGVDALVTREKIFLSVTVADCLPIYFYDSKNRIIGIAHAGWRGILKGIIENTLDKMIELGGEIKNIEIVLGPGLRNCHFEIKKDILDKFENYPQCVIEKDEKIFVDLFGIAKEKLLDKGVLNKNIFDCGECTFCNKEKYFSFRRDKPKKIEAMVAVIGIK